MRLDRLDEVDWVEVQKPLTQILSTHDRKMEGADLVMSAALLLISACERFGLRTASVLQRADNIRYDLRRGNIQGGGRNTLAAMEAYLASEVVENKEEGRPQGADVAARIKKAVDAVGGLGG